MNEKDIKEIAVSLRNEIALAQKITSDTDMNAVFFSAESIVSCLSYLISPIAEMEQKYRAKIVQNMDTMAHNKAEALAKASEEYKEWRKYSSLYDLGHEQIMLLKAFRKNQVNEFNRN